MKANLTSELKLIGSKSEVKILYVRLPCNPIFPIGPIYLADHVHKCFPKIQQLIIDLASLPILDVERILINSIKNFKPIDQNQFKKHEKTWPYNSLIILILAKKY